ncbi:hypothetical protein [Nocardia huaxiensis]|uniref:Uncharacterized protein n=1 Tax=Nocardia huaxiensis TaxID=2755382 RepID=A0A7D6VDZ0_9NOCA|nr:hypothetical protein [Nocardia huaxiensis]QLY27530.1 hypothetical protein H0264_37500 [Nocardia huaxiensis]UFS94221.1 hypothetical protein LPY97_26095 [Nocardia huaxiensis]
MPSHKVGQGKMCPVSDVTIILLLALAGFLLGGAYSTWKTSRPVAIGLLACGILAAVGAFLWWK